MNQRFFIIMMSSSFLCNNGIETGNRRKYPISPSLSVSNIIKIHIFITKTNESEAGENKITEKSEKQVQKFFIVSNLKALTAERMNKLCSEYKSASTR